MEYGQGGQDGGYNRGGYNKGGSNDGGYNYGNSDYNKPSQPNFNFGNGDNSGGGGGGGGDGYAGCIIFLVYLIGIVFVIPSAFAAIFSGLLLMVVLRALFKQASVMSWWGYYRAAFYTTVVYSIVYVVLSVGVYYINKPAYVHYLQNETLDAVTLKNYLNKSNVLLVFGVSTAVLHGACVLIASMVLRSRLLAYGAYTISYWRTAVITLLVILPSIVLTIGLAIVLALYKGWWM